MYLDSGQLCIPTVSWAKARIPTNQKSKLFFPLICNLPHVIISIVSENSFHDLLFISHLVLSVNLELTHPD